MEQGIRFAPTLKGFGAALMGFLTSSTKSYRYLVFRGGGKRALANAEKPMRDGNYEESIRAYLSFKCDYVDDDSY